MSAQLEASRPRRKWSTILKSCVDIRNRLPGTIEKIVSDKVVSEVVIRTAAGVVTSIIRTDSVERMNLKEGHNVFAVTKATSVLVERNNL